MKNGVAYKKTCMFLQFFIIIVYSKLVVLIFTNYLIGNIVEKLMCQTPNKNKVLKQKLKKQKTK